MPRGPIQIGVAGRTTSRSLDPKWYFIPPGVSVTRQELPRECAGPLPRPSAHPRNPYYDSTTRLRKWFALIQQANPRVKANCPREHWEKAPARPLFVQSGPRRAGPMGCCVTGGVNVRVSHWPATPLFARPRCHKTRGRAMHRSPCPPCGPCSHDRPARWRHRLPRARRHSSNNSSHPPPPAETVANSRDSSSCAK